MSPTCLAFEYHFHAPAPDTLAGAMTQFSFSLVILFFSCMSDTFLSGTIEDPPADQETQAYLDGQAEGQ